MDAFLWLNRFFFGHCYWMSHWHVHTYLLKNDTCRMVYIHLLLSCNIISWTPHEQYEHSNYLLWKKTMDWKWIIKFCWGNMCWLRISIYHWKIFTQPTSWASTCDAPNNYSMCSVLFKMESIIFSRCLFRFAIAILFLTSATEPERTRNNNRQPLSRLRIPEECINIYMLQIQQQKCRMQARTKPIFLQMKKNLEDGVP